MNADTTPKQTYPPVTWTVRLAPGPPLLHATLGLLPGPPVALLPDDARQHTLLVDDRNAGTDVTRGGHKVRLISTREALALMVAAGEHAARDPSAAPSRSTPAASAHPEPVVGLREAADHLRVGRATIRARIAELPPHRRPTNTASPDAPRWWWPSADAVCAWWLDIHRVDAPAPRRVRQRQPPPTDERSLAERLRALSEPK
jgi:hypothetical protein